MRSRMKLLDSSPRLLGVALAGLRRLGAGARAGPARSLRMTDLDANEAHSTLFNEIAAEYKATHPDVTEITFDSLPVRRATPRR